MLPVTFCLFTRTRVRFVSVILSAGDGLFLPSGWWHLVEGRTDYSAACNWYFRTTSGSAASQTGTHTAVAPQPDDDDKSEQSAALPDESEVAVSTTSEQCATKKRKRDAHWADGMTEAEMAREARKLAWR